MPTNGAMMVRNIKTSNIIREVKGRGWAVSTLGEAAPKNTLWATKKYQAKAMVDQLQSQKAHKQYHMIQQMNTQMDVADAELLHAPIWFARYDHKGSKIVLVLDANSGALVNSIGL